MTSTLIGRRTTAYTRQATLQCVIDGGGAPITTGVKADIVVPFDCTIASWEVLADQTGSISLDVWRDVYANYPPTVAGTITGSEQPALTSATHAQSAVLAGWTTSLQQGDILRVNVQSATTVTRVTLTLTVQSADPLAGAAGGTGTVTSVGVTTSGVLHTVSGSPVTGAGTINLALKTQAKNTVLAGPTTGSDATPTMRALVAADVPAHASTHGPGQSDRIYYNYGDSLAGLIEPYPGLLAQGACVLTTQVAYMIHFTPDQSAASTPTKLYAVFEVSAAFTSATYFAVALCSVDTSQALTAILAQTGDIHATNLDIFTAPNTKTAAQVITANAGVYAVPLSLDASGSALGTLPTPTRGTRYCLMVMASGNGAGSLRGINAGANIQHWWISQALGQSSPGTIASALPLKMKTLTGQATGVLPGTSGGNALPAGTAGSAASVAPWIALAFA